MVYRPEVTCKTKENRENMKEKSCKAGKTTIRDTHIRYQSVPFQNQLFLFQSGCLLMCLGGSSAWVLSVLRRPRWGSCLLPALGPVLTLVDIEGHESALPLCPSHKEIIKTVNKTRKTIFMILEEVLNMKEKVWIKKKKWKDYLWLIKIWKIFCNANKTK